MPAWIKIFISAILGVIFLVSADKAYSAFSFSVNGIDKQTIVDKEEEIQVTLAINELPSESYFRVAFQKKSGDPYFGFIKNEKGEWTKINILSGNCTSYYYVTDTSTNEVVISLKIGGENEVDTGEYSIKGHRFTSSCSSNTGSENSIVVNLSLPVPTPSPEPSPPPTPSPTPSSEPESEPDPSPSPSPSPTSVVVASPKVSPKTSTKKPVTTSLFDSHDSEEMLLSTEGGEILGSTEGAEASESEKEKSPYLIPIILGVLGLGLIGGTGVVFYKQRGYNGKDEKDREI